jgi:hypothetical protein
MRLILSRKGFDSTSGGCANPILPDGSMIALPIPDRTSAVRYRDLRWRGLDLGDVVEALTRGRRRRDHGAHVDPDLRPELRPRPLGWRPALGQHDAAQGHLRNQGVGPGDLFLFWGVFRDVDRDLRWAGPPRHVVWGWLQVDTVVAVDRVRDQLGSARWRWASAHPHLAFRPDPQNTLYLGRKRLSGEQLGDLALPGAGVLERFDPRLQLTARGASSPLTWSLPAWFLPEGRPPLTYHRRRARWRRGDDCVLLRAVSRGQEFVLDAEAYPEARGWAAELLGARAGELLRAYP